jgi:uncharacterized membrane protein (DUF2068 family)
MSGRPIGVTILSILSLIAGISDVILGAVFLVFGQSLNQLFITKNPTLSGLTVLFEVLGFAFIIYGIILILTGWGLFKGKRWSWWITTIIAGLVEVSSILSVIATGKIEGISGVVIGGIILFYMLRPHVKMYFGMY